MNTNENLEEIKSLLKLLESRLTTIELDIKEIKNDLKNMDGIKYSLKNMDNHISFIESIYEKIKSPFQIALSQFSLFYTLPPDNLLEN